jgi:hypothetical protein
MRRNEYYSRQVGGQIGQDAPKRLVGTGRAANTTRSGLFTKAPSFHSDDLMPAIASALIAALAPGTGAAALPRIARSPQSGLGCDHPRKMGTVVIKSSLEFGQQLFGKPHRMLPGAQRGNDAALASDMNLAFAHMARADLLFSLAADWPIIQLLESPAYRSSQPRTRTFAASRTGESRRLRAMC